MVEITKVGEYYETSNGYTFKTKEAAELTHLAETNWYCSGRSDLHKTKNQWYFFITKAVGYINMAEAAEPDCGRIQWLKCFITEGSGKSNTYMHNVTSAAVKVIKKSNPNSGYLGVLNYARKDYVRLMKQENEGYQECEECDMSCERCDYSLNYNKYMLLKSSCVRHLFENDAELP
jgi:hypothetical protein